MKISFVCGTVLVLMVLSMVCGAQTAVTTYQVDNYRSGANTHETTLTPANVNVAQFGKKRVFSVAGQVYAQPLYVPNVNINGVPHNVVYIATEHDQVYAFDVDSGQMLWQKNLLITTGPLLQVTPVPNGDVSCDDLTPEIGITGTPVIDVPNNKIFLVTKTKEKDLTTGHISYFQTVYALDIRTGALRTVPRRVAGTFPGTGDGSHNGILTFDPLIEGQRSALLMANNLVYIAWASHCDQNVYHGWLIAYDKLQLFPSGIFVDTPNGREGGYWSGGSGPAADAAGSLFIASGNGTYDANADYGDSVMRLTQSGRNIVFQDYFTPWDQSTLDTFDIDLGSGGVTLLPDQPGTPHPHLLVQVGKEGTIDLINRDNMGHFHPNNDSQIVQTLPEVVGGVFGGPGFWNNTAYFGGSDDTLKAFSFNPQTQLLSTTPTSHSPEVFGFPGPTPAISSNGTSNGIVWVIEHQSGGQAVLRAYNATNLGIELYNTTQNPSRDSAGTAVKFGAPTVADGHVFVGAQNQVSMYGLLQ